MASLALKPRSKAEKKPLTAARLKTYLTYHAMLLPFVVLLFIFAYVPMPGILMAFQYYNPSKGLFHSEWVGFANFTKLFIFNDLGNVIFNTVFIATMKIAAGLVVPIICAILLNEIGRKYFVRTVQTFVYLPHFLSWVIMAGIVMDILSPSDGIVNKIIQAFGGKPIFFLGSPALFPFILVGTDIWKEFGYGTIVYLAALTGIDPTLYEAAKVDGANRWKQTIHITLPGMSQIIVLSIVLSVGGILEAGFDQIYNLYNPIVKDTGEVIDTLVYRLSFKNSTAIYGFSLSTAVGLMKSVVAMFLLILSYKLADKLAGYRIF